MSIRENIEIFHHFDIEEYLNVLKDEFHAREHPAQPGSFLVEEPGLPFYKPKQMEDHVSILSFNGVPLSETLLQALMEHPEMIPDDMVVRWTQEQDLIMETTIGDLRKLAGLENGCQGM